MRRNDEAGRGRHIRERDAEGEIDGREFRHGRSDDYGLKHS